MCNCLILLKCNTIFHLHNQSHINGNWLKKKKASVKIPVHIAFPTFPYAEYLKFKLIEDEFKSKDMYI